MNLHELLIGRSLAEDVWVWKASFTDSTSNRFFENEPNETCSKKGPKDRFFAPDKLENHTSEGKGECNGTRVP